jgi:DNA-binding transcriptional MerR regulator
MRIGELARRTGVSVRALRYYEEKGLLVPVRTANGYRDYPHVAVSAVGCIQLLYAAGLSSADLAQVLPACGDYSAAMSAGQARELRAVRTRLAAEIEQRQASLQLLDEVLAAAREDGAGQLAPLPTAGGNLRRNKIAGRHRTSVRRKVTGIGLGVRVAIRLISGQLRDSRSAAASRFAGNVPLTPQARP